MGRAWAEAAKGCKRGLRRGVGEKGKIWEGCGEGEGGTRSGVGLRRSRDRGEEGGGEIGEGRWIDTGVGGKGTEVDRVWTQSATPVTEEVCVAPPSEVYRKVGTQPAWRWGPVGSRLPSPGAKRRRGPTSVTRHRPRSGPLKTRPIKSVPSRVGEERTEVGEVGRGGGRSDSAKWK